MRNLAHMRESSELFMRFGPTLVVVLLTALGVLRGIAQGDFADVLFRAAAFARVVATGRAGLVTATEEEVVRMLALAEQLEAAGHLELAHELA